MPPPVDRRPGGDLPEGRNLQLSGKPTISRGPAACNRARDKRSWTGGFMGRRGDAVTEDVDLDERMMRAAISLALDADRLG